ncbi:NADPH:quinone reductase-like Zn-dependent oxidoreductase [Bradyrhizobium sp. LB7.2]
MGSYAPQLARHAGCANYRNSIDGRLSFVRDLGANTVIDYRIQRFENEVRDADAVIDLVGGETQSRSFQVLSRRQADLGSVRPDQDLAKHHGVEATFFLGTSRASI